MSDIVIYQADDGKTNLEVHLEQESVWLNLNQMTDLFGRDKSVLSRHLNNVFRENELDRQAVVAKFATTASDGKTYQVDFLQFCKTPRNLAPDTLRTKFLRSYSSNSSQITLG